LLFRLVSALGRPCAKPDLNGGGEKRKKKKGEKKGPITEGD